MRCTPRSYLRILALSMVLSLGSIVALNVAVDPFGTYRGVDRLDPYWISKTSRVIVGERVLQTPCDTLILGTSRGEGLNEKSPRFAGRPTLNASIQAGSIEEMQRIVSFACRVNKPRRILLCPDFFQFSTWQKPIAEFHSSRLATDFSSFEYHCDKLFGYNALRSSLKLLKTPSFSLSGPSRSIVDPWSSPREALSVGPPVASVRTPGKTRASFDAETRKYISAKGCYGRYEYSTECLEQLRSIVQAALSNDIELIVVILPVHAVDLEALNTCGLWGTFETWKRHLAGICREEQTALNSSTVPVWDFTLYNSYCVESIPSADSPDQMAFFIDGAHFTVRFGEIVLQRILHDTEKEDDIAVRLDRVELDRHFASIRRDREIWIASHAAEMANVRAIARRVNPMLFTTAPLLIAAEPTELRR